MSKAQPWVDSGPGVSLCREGGQNGCRPFPTRPRGDNTSSEIEYADTYGSAISPREWMPINTSCFHRPLKVRV